jgi:multicomponent Na+:H+ antiporter subunit B
MGVSGFGLFLGALAGIPSLFRSQTFMTSQWLELNIFHVEIVLSTPLFFDIGVYLVVVGSIGSIALALEEREAD